MLTAWSNVVAFAVLFVRLKTVYLLMECKKKSEIEVESFSSHALLCNEAKPSLKPSSDSEKK